MKLIDSNELWVQIYKLYNKHRWKERTNIAFRKCLDTIQFFPTVDAEPVVRCKDCKYATIDNDAVRRNCGLHLVVDLNDDDFCSRGEKKEDAN